MSSYLEAIGEAGECFRFRMRSSPLPKDFKQPSDLFPKFNQSLSVGKRCSKDLKRTCEDKLRNKSSDGNESRYGIANGQNFITITVSEKSTEIEVKRIVSDVSK